MGHRELKRPGEMEKSALPVRLYSFILPSENTSGLLHADICTLIQITKNYINSKKIKLCL